MGLRGTGVSDQERLSSVQSRLEEIRYDNQAGDFVRFRDDPTDDTVRTIVNGVVAGGGPDENLLRRLHSEESTDTLRLFAMRATLQARRRGSFNLIDDAMTGFALLPAIADVPWDSWVKAALFVARSLGRDLDSVGERFADVASEDAVARFDIALESMNRVEALEQCRMSEVTTTHGVGYVETLVFRDKSSYSFYTPPRVGDDIIVFHPITNLAQLAVTLADSLDAEGEVVTGPIAQDQLAGTLCSMQVAGSYLDTTGCLSFVVDSTKGQGSFTVFVAEFPDGTQMDELVDGAQLDGQLVFVSAQRLILFVAQPSFDENAEPDVDLTAYSSFAETALKESAPTGWHLR
jgi:hypothetical protein